MSHTKQHNNVSYKSDDGDEGDVSSDDSLRLKLSDDENTEAAEQPTNLQTPKREDQRNTEARSSKVVRASKKHPKKVLGLNESRKNHITSSKRLTKRCIRIKRTVKINMHSNRNSGRWSSSFSSRNYYQTNYHSNRSSSNGRPYFKHKSRYHKNRNAFYNKNNYNRFPPTNKKERRDESFAEDDVNSHPNQFIVDDHNRREEKHDAKIDMKEDKDTKQVEKLSVETEKTSSTELKCEKEVDSKIKEDTKETEIKQTEEKKEPTESTKVELKEDSKTEKEDEENQKEVRSNSIDEETKEKNVEETKVEDSKSSETVLDKKLAVEDKEDCDKQGENDSNETSEVSKSQVTSEVLTNGDNDDTIEEISIDISSDNESDHVSNFAEALQDCTNNEDSNDRFQTEETSDGKEKEVVTNGNNLDETFPDDEQTADASDSNEEEQNNTETSETQMDQSQDKGDEGQMIEEVDIEESNENLYGSAAGVNIIEEVEKTQLSTTEEVTLREATSSPSSLKRSSNIINGDCGLNAKKAKVETKKSIGSENKSMYLQQLQELFMNKQKLRQMTQEGLVDLLVQKCAEAITMNSEIGKLKQQLQLNEKNQEAMKTRCQQLTKQLKDFEMVLKRNELDRRSSGDKFVAPIKINRSVGLQVTLLSDQGIQTLRQVQGNKNAGLNSARQNQRTNSNSVRRVKVNTPRRVASTTASITTATQSPQTVAVAKSVNLTATTTALVVSKSTELPQVSRTATLPNNAVRSTVSAINNQQTSPKIHLQQKHVVINGITSPANRPQIATLSVQKNQPKSNDLIDLTDEEDKKKTPIRGPTILTQAIAQPAILSDAIIKQHNTVQQSQATNSARYQRVIQTISGSILNQSNNIRLVQPANQLTSTSLVNNNPPRLTYIMPTGPGQGRQVVITSSNQIRPINANMKNQYSTVTYKTNVANVTAVTGIQNGTVTRILPAPANVQISRHPAPLPATPPYEMNPLWKLPPPAPSLKITKMTTGIVLSWTLSLTDRYEEIASYQLFAYQEISGVAPSTDMWKKVGDVRALPLPMACTLTQFSPGNNYYFAVRAVDTHSRYGQYSQPGNISL